MTQAIEMSGVEKSFGDTIALAGVDLTVTAGTIFGLLGPNGAGKTTIVRILATLTRLDRGSARVFGSDVTRNSDAVRRKIALTGQSAAIDGVLTGRENLEMFGELLRLPKKLRRQRAADLLELLDLGADADRPARTYSGGMRRRLDLASSLIIRPQLLFLDEPTTGLDPRSRNAIWELTRALVDDGTTVLLTTQYLEEADQLANRIAVIEHGHIIAEGGVDELKAQIGGEVVEIVFTEQADIGALTALLPDTQPGSVPTSVQITVDPDNAIDILHQVSDCLRPHSRDIASLGLRRPTLDDVFLSLTGRATQSKLSEKPAQRPRRRSRGMGGL
ncbi:MAG: ATP-binding cassette domain-containing protein [Nitriliruptoraceae bacterium]